MKECVYLNQPLFETNDPVRHLKKEKEIIDIIKAVKGDEVVVRLHPRETEKRVYKSLHIENDRAMWELICENNLSEKSILIASFSTAQFTPKMYCNKEPRLVFTYKLYDDYKEGEIEKFTLMVEKLREVYTDKERILIPKSIQDLKEAIRQC